MRQQSAVFAHDGPCLDGTQVSLNTHFEHLLSAFEYGHPFLFTHDYHRPIGWSYPRALYFEPGLRKLLGTLKIAESQKESEDLLNVLNSYFEYLINRESSEFQILQNILAPHLNGTYQFHRGDSVALIEANLAVRAAPRLFELRDHDGLVPLYALDEIAPGAFKVGDLVVFAHQFYRRSYSRLNSLNSHFLRRLGSLKNGNPRIALDPDMVGLARTCIEHDEFQYWRGPKFNDELLTIEPGVTVHAANDSQRLYQLVSKTEFWWKSHGGERSLEVEEIRDRPCVTDSSDTYGCRYAHSILGKDTGDVFHFDGAVRTYTEEAMVLRLEQDISKAGKNTQYKKIWRIDGDSCVDVPTWKSLLTDYFRDNALVGEYLGTYEKEDEEPEIPRGTLPSILNKMVSLHYLPGQGVRLAISFRSRKEELLHQRSLLPSQFTSMGGSRKPLVEAICFELKKSINRAGGELCFPEEFVVIDHGNTSSLCIPPILHCFSHWDDNIELTIKAIKQMLLSGLDEARNRIIGYSLGVPFSEESDLFISVVGPIPDLLNWIDNPISKIPSKSKDFISWINEVAQYLDENFQVEENLPNLGSLVDDFGTLCVEPTYLKEENHAQIFDDNGVKLDIPLRDQQLCAALEGGLIQVCAARIYDSAKCLRCTDSYFECDCSTWCGDDLSLQTAFGGDESVVKEILFWDT